jgi:hypothetical protein
MRLAVALPGLFLQPHRMRQIAPEAPLSRRLPAALQKSPSHRNDGIF